MLKRIVLILLLFSVMIAGGCSLPEPSLQDELREIDSDLQWAMVDIASALEQCEKLEKELHFVNTSYGEYIENVGVLGDSIGDCEGMANILVTLLSELQEDIGEAQYRLSDIVR